MSPSERYIRECKAAGLTQEHARWLLRRNIVLQPRQLAFAAACALCDTPCSHHPDAECTAECAPNKIGFGGARGGGKSHVGLAQVVYDLDRFAGLKFLYLRKVGKAGKEAVHDLRRSVLHSVPHEWRASTSTLELPNSSRCILGHFQNEKDIDNYLGLEYDGALVEEATQLTRRKIRDISTCVRTSKEGWRPRQYYTTNPGNIGHAWFKDLFISPLRRGTQLLTRFVQATVRDNRFVNAGYRRELEALTGWQRKAWLEGDWDIAAGQYFSAWRERFHVGRFEAQPHWTFWLSFDYGYTHHTAVTLLAEDDDGNLFIIDQHCRQRTQVPDHALAVDAMLSRYGLERVNLSAFVAGHDMWTPKDDGRSVADHYADNGFYLTKARIDRISGAQEIIRRLGDPEGEPARPATLVIHERCTRLIECMPSLIHDENRPEDVLKVDCDEDGTGGDDPYDSARYGVMHAARNAVGGAAVAKKARTQTNPWLDGRRRA